MISEVYNCNCLQYMKTIPDQYFELAIVDPPYGLGKKLTCGGGNHLKFKNDITINEWDKIPPPYYFVELFRISKNQIIWGANYFHLPPYRCPVIWDKLQPCDNFSAFELAWTSFDRPARKFEYRQAGFIGENKIHPCQKPVPLYKWLLKEFGEKGDKILDTHMGSQSSRIAAYQMGFDYWGCEINKKYFEDGCNRYDEEVSQLMLF